LQVLPGLILDAESLFAKVPKSGTSKKAFVVDAVKRGLSVAAFFGAKDVQPTVVQDQIVVAAGELTDAVVAGFNRANLFGAVAPQA